MSCAQTDAGNVDNIAANDVRKMLAILASPNRAAMEMQPVICE